MEGSDEAEVNLKERVFTPGKSDGRSQGSYEPKTRNCFKKLNKGVFQAQSYLKSLEIEALLKINLFNP